MNAWICVRVAQERLVELFPGSIIGRALTADLSVPDPWISEAHAIVSLRDGVLKLLGLRGRFEFGGAVLTELVLRPGMSIRLSASTQIDVVEVVVPDRMLVLTHPDFNPVLLTRTLSIHVASRRVAPGADAAADAVLFSDGARWFARSGGELAPIIGGQRLVIGGEVFAVTDVDTAAAGGQTAGVRGSETAPLQIVLMADSMQLRRDGRVVVTLDGKVGRVVQALAERPDGESWTALCSAIWPDVSEPTPMRRNWDATMARLRKKLRAAGVRTDLVRSDYGGTFQLKLYRGDTITDER